MFSWIRFSSYTKLEFGCDKINYCHVGYSGNISDINLSSPGFFGSSQPGGGTKCPPHHNFFFYWAYNDETWPTC